MTFYDSDGLGNTYKKPDPDPNHFLCCESFTDDNFFGADLIKRFCKDVGKDPIYVDKVSNSYQMIKMLEHEKKTEKNGSLNYVYVFFEPNDLVYRLNLNYLQKKK